MAMRRLRPWLILVLALACGVTAATLALRYIRQRTTPLMAAERVKGRLAVASRELAVGTVVSPSDVRLLEWPGTGLPAGYLPTVEAAVGRGLITPVHENEPLIEAKLAPKGAGGGMTVMIDEGMRAFSVKVDEVVGVAGFVLPDTRVDVLLTLQGSGQSREPVTQVLLQNVRTLAAGQEIQQDKNGKPRAVQVVTLLVSPPQAETLALAANEGKIQLALRNQMDTLRIATPGAKLGGLFASRTPPSSPRRSSPVRVENPGPGRDSTVVEVYKGGARTLLKF